MIRRLPITLSSILLALVAVPAAAQTEAIEYYGLDHLGSVRVIFNASGQLVDRMDYSPFGENLKAAIKFPVEQFAGTKSDAETGQFHAEARNYIPAIGRFNAPDPAYAGLFDPQAWNRYAYALNSPLLYADPSGEIPCSFCYVEVTGKAPIVDPIATLIGSWWAEFQASRGRGRQSGSGRGNAGERPGRDSNTEPDTAPDPDSEPPTDPCSPPPGGNDDGGLISFVPVMGPATSAVSDFKNGSYGWGSFNAVMAASELAFLK